jgi:hypothetical protein
MFDMRKRLSPVKINKINPRGSLSEDSHREKESEQQTVFLNIEKLHLIKISTQIDRVIKTNKGNSP